MMTRRTLFASLIGAPVTMKAATVVTGNTLSIPPRLLAVTTPGRNLAVGDYIYDKWYGPSSPHVIVAFEDTGRVISRDVQNGTIWRCPPICCTRYDLDECAK